MVLTASFVLSSATGLSCHRHPQKLLSANLTPASGCRDHTPSPSASAPFVIGASTSTASHPASVTIAIRPSSGTGWLKNTTDLVFLKIRIFFREGLDRQAGKAQEHVRDLPVGWRTWTSFLPLAPCERPRRAKLALEVDAMPWASRTGEGLRSIDKRDPSSAFASLRHLLPQGEKGRSTRLTTVRHCLAQPSRSQDSCED
jgi:hypothetical protein